MECEHTTILAAITSIASQYPDDTAVVHDNSSYSYAQLQTYSSFIASRLLKLNIRHGDSVALCLDKSFHAIAAMLGGFKVGAAFVPIDPALPNDRIAFMVEDASVRAVLCAPSYKSKFNNNQIDIAIGIEELGDELDEHFNPVSLETSDRFNINKALKGHDRAYIMYTSGSTGKPKGVPVSHRALLNYCIADAHVYQLEKSDRTLQFSTLSFDIAIEEIFPPLMVGSTIVVRPTQRSDAQVELSDIVNTYHITALHMATGYWHEWVDLMNAATQRAPETIRLMVVTGEKVSPEHYQRWQALTDQPTLWANAYGPTEATVTATVFIPSSDWQGKSLPIGKPILNYTAYILDCNKKPVAKNETGELFIGGPSLADGYLNRPDLTAQAFFPDPFVDETSALMYRTGDLARWMNDGNIEYAGRIDHQIKIGSYRIEPGEIENAISEHPDVKDALVIPDEVNDKKLLLAFVATDDTDLTAGKIANFLSKTLPAYMVPARYVLLANLPKTLNGKIDRKALPDNSQAVAPISSDYIAPVGKVQEQLCAIWSYVLGIPDVGSDSSFISLGGDSLLAVKTISRIQSELGFTVSTRDFFYLDTVAQLAGYIEGKPVDRVVPAPLAEFTDQQGRQLYTVLQTPKPELDNGIGLLIVPPLGNEQRRTQRPFRLLMQNLAKQGYTTLRFDWTGTGNSSGNGSDLLSMNQWCEDIRDAAHKLSQSCSTMDIVAVRTGALIAASTDLFQTDVRKRYYWDPVFSGQQWLQDMKLLQQRIMSDSFRFLRERKLDSSNITEFAGLTISKPLQHALIECDMRKLLTDNKWNHDSHLLLTNPVGAEDYNDLPCHIHTVAEENDWNNERATTVDMRINKAASLIADLLISDSITDNKIKIHNNRRTPQSKPISIGNVGCNSAGTQSHPIEAVSNFGSGSQFVGVYTPPIYTSKAAPCILYITAGLLHHVGPTRLYVELARSLSNQQVAGFRFDLSGIGESETSSMGGYFTERSVVEIRAAMDYIQATFHHDQFILLGLCSGADDALATAQQDERVAGLVLLNGYAYKTGKFRFYRFKEFYLPRILMLKKWKSRFKKLLSNTSLNDSQQETSASATMSDEDREAVIAMDDDYRYIPSQEQTGLLIDSLSKRDVNMYFIYTGSEHEDYAYKGQLMDMFPRHRNNPGLQEDYIKDADHTYILQADRDKLAGLLRNWLANNF